MAFVPIADAIDEIRAGRIVVVVDDEDRENEGDLTIAAERDYSRDRQLHGDARTRADLSHADGGTLRCAALAADLAAEYLGLSERPSASQSTRAKASPPGFRRPTARARSSPQSIPIANRRIWRAPATCFPLRAREGGVLVRAGQTEAACDLARLAGLEPAGVICEIMNEDGTMARVPQLKDLLRSARVQNGIGCRLIRYRLKTERFIHRSGRGLHRIPIPDLSRTIAYASKS